MVPDPDPQAPDSSEPDSDVLAAIILSGDISGLSKEQKVRYYLAVCKRKGLDPMLHPFDFIKDDKTGKEKLVANKNSNEQLREKTGMDVFIVGRQMIGEEYVVTARAKLPGGRQDESTAAVSLLNTAGQKRANLMMSCETKAKNRVTQSISATGMIDETEARDVPTMHLAPGDPVASITGTMYDEATLASPSEDPVKVENARLRVERLAALKEWQKGDSPRAAAVRSALADAMAKQACGLAGELNAEAVAAIYAAHSDTVNPETKAS